MTLNTGLSSETQKGVTKILNGLLSDEYTLYTKTRNYHWNVAGPQFIELHKFFETQYEQIDESIDAVAERIRALGAYPFGSMAEFSKNTRLKEAQGGPSNANDMIATLVADHETIIRTLRTDLESCGNTYKDMGTSDFLTGLMEDHEKMAWMLRAHLEA